MSTVDTLLKSLLVASNGISMSERQAEARVRTKDYFDLDWKQMKAGGLLAVVKQVEADIVVLRDAATAAKSVTLVEVYDASLSVFAKWTAAKEDAA